MIQQENWFYKKYLKSNNQETPQAFSQIQERVRLAIEDSKKQYYKKLSNKLLNNTLNWKSYSITQKYFFTVKKIPCILPLLHKVKFVTNFQVKSEIFSFHFAKQCSLLKNESRIRPQLLLRTNTCLSNFKFSGNDVWKVIWKLDASKAHGHNKIKTFMFKLNDIIICKPLHMIFTSCLQTGVFPLYWKKVTVVPIHKKESKQPVKNNRPVSPLSICVIIFAHTLLTTV